jgi:SAM-dependent methyltransferase
MPLTGVTSLLKRRRRELDIWLDERNLAHTFSLASYGLFRRVERLVETHACGVVLDAGSGRAPYCQRLREKLEVITIDIEDRDGRVTHIADIQNMPVIAGQSVRTVICTEVLEHVPAPWRALGEIARVLEPGGVLILSVPYLAPIHEAPRDYYRFTRFALERLLSDAGLEIESLDEVGGVLAFLGHGASMIVLGTLGAARSFRSIAWTLNYAVLIRFLGLLDRTLGFADVYPCNYVLVARKPINASSATVSSTVSAQAGP